MLEKGIKLNADKVQFRQKEVPTWVTALIQTSCEPLMTCPPPQTSKVSREYLALQIIYRSSPLLRELVKKENEFVWEQKVHGK